MAPDDHESQGQPPRKERSRAFYMVAGGAAGAVLVGGCMLAVFGSLLAPALFQGNLRANEAKCASNLRQIGLAAIQYASENGAFPSVPEDPTGEKAIELLIPEYLSNRELVSCPCQAPGDFSYEGFPVPLTKKPARARPIAWDKRPHPDGTRCLVFTDGRGQRVDGATFEAMLARAREPAGGR